MKLDLRNKLFIIDIPQIDIRIAHLLIESLKNYIGLVNYRYKNFYFHLLESFNVMIF